MNNLADNKKPAIFKHFARGIGEIDRALDSVTKAKLFRQAHGRVAHGNDAARATHFFDNVAPIMGLDLFLHRGHDVRGAQINFLARRCAAGNKIRAHKIMPRKLSGPPAYSSKAPLGFWNAPEVTIRLAGGSGALESSTRCTFESRVASSGCEVAMFTGVPIFTSAKNFGAASPCNRMQPCVLGYGCTKP